MKQFGVFFIAIILNSCLFAQDTIFFLDGTFQEAQLIELSRPYAKYRVHGYSDGPLITADFNRIKAVSLETGDKLIQENGELKPLNGKSNISMTSGFGTFNTDRTQSVGSFADTVFIEVPIEVEEEPEPDYMDNVLKLSGPRVGATYFTRNNSDLGIVEAPDFPLVSQFGWQLETRYFTLENGTQGLIEFIGLIGGMDQGYFLPNASVLIGIRDSKGLEIGFGPNISVTGAAFVIAAGMSFRTENVYIPMNLAFTASPKNPRISLLVGFNGRRR